MKTTIKVEKEVDIKTLRVAAGVRYWEDAKINGVEDTEDGDNMPGKFGEAWCPVIDFETGVVKDWPKGVTADIHYKVCDNGCYYLLDENDSVILKIEQDYVPRCMCPEANGYGDYIIMKIDENGQIAKWNPTLDNFIDND